LEVRVVLKNNKKGRKKENSSSPTVACAFCNFLASRVFAHSAQKKRLPVASRTAMTAEAGVWVVVRGGEDDGAIVQVSKATKIRLVTEQGDGGTAIIATFRDLDDEVELAKELPLERAWTLLRILQRTLVEGGPPVLEMVRGPKTGTIYLREPDQYMLQDLADKEEQGFERERENEDSDDA
jgi:hypothetical protein